MLSPEFQFPVPDRGCSPQDGACVNLLIDDEEHCETINAMPHFSGVPVDIIPRPNR